MVSKAELVKTQILATGLSKNIKGFTLLELLVVLLIIGIASSVILVNNSSINNIINGQTSVEKNFQLISEESILSSKILGWFPGKSSQKIYILDSNGNKTSEFNSESLDSYWNGIAEYQKIIKGNDAEEIEIESDITDYPLLIFYPSGENSGAELLIYRNEYIQKITISQNGKIINETELQ